MQYIIFLIICLLLVLFWMYQFIQLMLLSDSDFPGRNDKILWVAAFILVFFLAPFAFRHWKTAYRMMREEEGPAGP